MFNRDFYPTPDELTYKMLQGYDVHGKTVLEPQAGKADIVKVLQKEGANVIACEINPDLRKIVEGYCKVIASDFLTVTSDQVSHVQFIVMNPPFSGEEKHILHAWDIAPPGCVIISLCNSELVKNPYHKARKQVTQIVEEFGTREDLDGVFGAAERQTNVNISLLVMTKPADSYKEEFNGFFMGEDEPETQQNALMSYNIVRDLVNRYVAAVKLYDQQLETGVKMNDLTSGFYSSEHGFCITQDAKPKARTDFKKDLQKEGWNFVFEKMNLKKYATRGLKDDINKFVEQQQAIPYTMRNIYQMINIVIATTGQRMEKALEEVFDRVTSYHDDNRQNIEGWKTNSHYLLTRRFIIPCIAEARWTGGGISARSTSNFDMLEDMLKALCYITGDKYGDFLSLQNTLDYDYTLVDAQGKQIKNPSYDFDVHYSEREAEKLKYAQEMHPGSVIKNNVKEWGKWFEWSYFRVRCYKKGTAHMEFKDEEVWARFNQRIAKIKGYPLPEHKHTKETDKRNAATAKNYRPPVRPTKQGAVLFEVDVTPVKKDQAA